MSAESTSHPQVAIVTDSTADIPSEQAERYNIHVVPNIIILDNHSLLDGRDISREEFYTRLPYYNPLPTTATASSGVYEDLYARLLKAGFSAIVSIHTSSRLSGIFNAATIAAQTVSGPIHVIDSQSVSMGLGWQVLAAAEDAINGLKVDRVLEHLAWLRPRLRLVAMLDTMEYLRRSGRVSWARARLGGLLRIKPFVEVDQGQVLSIGQARTFRAGYERLRKLLLERGPFERLAILHTNAEEEACRLLDSLDKKWDVTPFIVNVTTVIGTHVGPNGLGFAGITVDNA